MYQLEFKPHFIKSAKKIINKDETLKKKLKKALVQLMLDPKYPSLRSHLVDTIDNQNVWSSNVTSDIRIIWEYEKEEIKVLNVLNLGTHSGANQIYKNKS